jgi:hypothetical protein
MSLPFRKVLGLLVFFDLAAIAEAFGTAIRAANRAANRAKYRYANRVRLDPLLTGANR